MSDFLEIFVKDHDVSGLTQYLTEQRRFDNLALFDACDDGIHDISEVLIQFGADVNSVVVDQQTPLFIACLDAHPACVELLLAHGAIVSSLNSNNGVDELTPLMAAAYEDDYYYLIDNEINELVFNEFIQNRCLCIHLLLDAGAVIDQLDHEGETAIIHASWNYQLVELLIDVAHADVNLHSVGQTSALHWACVEPIDTKMMELLLAHGADIGMNNYTFCLSALLRLYGTAK